jgi:acyl-CoA reductase-like NAD-dependent aldehyde dehydrogenase
MTQSLKLFELSKKRIHFKIKNFFQTWADIPAPHRGEIVRQIGDELR